MADMHLPQGNNREVSGLEDSLLSLLVFLVFTTGGMGTWGCHGLPYKVFPPRSGISTEEVSGDTYRSPTQAVSLEPRTRGRPEEI